MSRLTAYQYEAADGGEMCRVLRSVTEMDGLLVLLTLLYLFIAGNSIVHPVLYMAAIAVYGALVLTLCYAPAFSAFPREKLVVAAAAMVVFITTVLAASGGGRGPLLNLYLLPIVTSALTLGRGPTILIVSMVLAGRVTLSHFVDGNDVVSLSYGLTVLAEGVPVLLVALLTSMLAADIQDVRQRLEATSDQDSVTGLLNLPAFTRLLEEESTRAGRRGNTFALLIIDIDGLKSVNERFGYEAGNRALAAVGQALRRSSRSVDLVARYGGDEFVMFLSGAGPAVAKVVANRIRHNVGTTTLEIGGNLHRVSVSIGAGVFPTDGRDVRDLIKAADRAVAKDKDSRKPLERNEAGLRASPSRSLQA
jgi:diguanylate cyclase (GGDEF)-like protein